MSKRNRKSCKRLLPYEVIQADTERDNYMSAEEAKAYGLIDEVIHNR